MAAEPSVISAIPDGPGWRDALLRSLSTTGVVVLNEERSLNQRTLVALARFLVLVVLIFLIVLMFVGAKRHAFGLGMWLGVAILPLLSLLYFSWRYSRAPTVMEEFRRVGGARPSLYLRPFSIDDEIARRVQLGLGQVDGLLNRIVVHEEIFAVVLRKIGPVIAVGHAGEILPRRGAARFFIRNDLWQQKVADAAKASRLILMTTGTTEGVRWEIAHLVATMPMEKLILCPHPQLAHAGAGEREREWKEFRESLGPLFPQPLPDQLGKILFLHFDASGAPLPVRSSAWRFLRLAPNAHADALSSVLRAKGLLPGIVGRTGRLLRRARGGGG